MAGGGDCGADSGQAAAGDEDVGIEADFAHVEFGGGHGRVGRRDAVEIGGSGRGGLLGGGVAGQYDKGVREELTTVHGGIVSGIRESYGSKWTGREACPTGDNMVAR